jgi:large subunit ribosomal protein L35
MSKGKTKKIKIKTHSSSKKRFSLTANGHVKRTRAGKQHLLTHKSTKLKRALRGTTIADDTNAAIIKKLIPYA